MSMLAKELLMAGTKYKKYGPIIKKKDDIMDSIFSRNMTTKELKQELDKAEEAYEQLKGTVPKAKLEVIDKKIQELREQLSKAGHIDTDEVVKHQGRTMAAPVFGELEEGLNEIDKAFNIPKKEQDAVEEKEKNEAVELLEEDLAEEIDEEEKKDGEDSFEEITPPSFDPEPKSVNQIGKPEIQTKESENKSDTSIQSRLSFHIIKIPPPPKKKTS